MLMEAIIVKGGKRLVGEITISGAKNAALTIIPAALMASKPVILTNVPDLNDISSMLELIKNMGAEVKIEGESSIIDGSKKRRITIDASALSDFVAPYDLVRKMRASILVMGPVLSRFGFVKVSLPGGCAIGARPVDMHIKALEQLGAEIELSEGYVIATSQHNKLKGTEIFFDKVSVGATENTIMAACLAEGKTTIHNAAREPEIVDLCNFLNTIGAKISGIGTDVISIEGVDKLEGGEYVVIGDRIEAGTYAVAAAITKGQLKIKGIDPELIRSLIIYLKSIGVVVEEGKDQLIVTANSSYKAIDIETKPYPNFPTDLQAQMMALFCLADGVSHIKETIFENRFMHVPELNRMGADISIYGNIAIVKGVEELKPAEVMATDLRASVALVLAALSIGGTSKIRKIYHLDRGYELLESKLRACGADIKRVEDISIYKEAA